jgi:hypothetical protein
MPRNVLFTLLLLVIAFRGARADDAPQAAKMAMGPRLATVARVDQENGEIVLREVMSRVVWNPQRTVVYEQRGFTLSPAMEAFDVFDVNGHKLTDDEVWKRIAVGTVVAVSADAKKVDPMFLKTLAKDTLVVVSPMYAVNAAMMPLGSNEHPVIPSESFSWDSVGMRLQPCDPSALEAVTGATPPLQGAVAVAEVRPNSPASVAGVRAGDLLVALGKWATNDLDQLRIVASKPDVAVNGRVKFYTVRNGGIQSGYFDLPTP